MPKFKVTIRIVVQTIFLGLWIFIFVQLGKQASTIVPPDLFLITDPLATLLSMSAARIWVPAVISSLLLIGLTLVLGRFFCGWICPLGTILDLVGFLWSKNRISSENVDKTLRKSKYYLLAALCASAVLGSQILFLFDPLVLMFRALATGLFPVKEGEVAFLPLLLLLVIIGLSTLTKRFWCRYLCPLGAFYGALSKFAIFRRQKKGCDGCKGLDHAVCQVDCAQGVGKLKQGSPEECIRCLSCEVGCDATAIKFVPSKPLPMRNENIVTLNRRTFFASIGFGAASGYAVFHTRSILADPWRVVRPPLVSDEDAFLNLCIRCGQCIKSCPTGTLQPMFLEGGISGLWSPAVTPRVGGCKDNCNACSVACPTNAIPEFGPTRPEKWISKMGNVSFEKHLCITYKDNAVKPCLKCVEICPNKAILVDYNVHPIRPYKVNYDLCLGCGLCETECRKMVNGRPALELSSRGVGLPTLLVKDPTPKLPKH